MTTTTTAWTDRLLATEVIFILQGPSSEIPRDSSRPLHVDRSFFSSIRSIPIYPRLPRTSVRFSGSVREDTREKNNRCGRRSFTTEVIHSAGTIVGDPKGFESTSSRRSIILQFHTINTSVSVRLRPLQLQTETRRVMSLYVTSVVRHVPTPSPRLASPEYTRIYDQIWSYMVIYIV
jgi:hypothetical protein